MLGLSKPALIAVAAGLLVAVTAAGVWLVYRKGETAGAADITTRVQSETIRTLDAARVSREKTDEEVQRTPYDDRADGLR
ncbi:hypothetical protein [Reyranella sp.]|uniref:hypothetical protein n=1 Tax=Reyranella sp. TaxID=1929291 RepID=UPI003D0D7FF4